jgi:hypothetical protein
LVAGPQQTILILLNFTNATISCSAVMVSNLVFSLTPGSVNSVYLATSFTNLLWSGIAVGPYSITYGSGSCDPNGWANAADAAATAAGIDLAAYAHKVYVLPGSGTCGWGGLATVGGNPSRAWVSSCDLVFQYAHEMGHGLGMNHASSDANNDGVIDAEYGDSSDFMSASYVLTGLNAPHMAQMQWMAEQKIQVLSVSGTYQLAPLELASGNTGWPQILTFDIPGSSDSYYISYRQSIGVDNYLASGYTSGITVHRWCCGSNTRIIQVLTDGAAFTDSASGLTVRQVSHTNAFATLSAELLANTLPIVPVLTAIHGTPDGHLSLTGTGSVGQVYWLLGTPSLVPPVAWTPIATNTADSSGTLSFTAPGVTNSPRRFYRVRVP